MRTREVDRRIAAADPLGAEALARLDLRISEDELLEGVDAASEPGPELELGRPRPRRRGRLVLALGGAALAVALAALLLLGSGSDRGSRAYGAALVRFAQHSPLLLLEAPGWRIQDASESRGREGIEGHIEFVTGKPIPFETIFQVGNPKRPRERGMFPPAVRQRRVELFWRQGSLAQWLSFQRGQPHPHGQHWVTLPVLGTEAQVDTRAEFYANLGRPGDRQMVALWREGGYALELRAAVSDLPGFEERLGWLTKVDQEAWLAAMPPKVVKAGDHDATVRELLRGIPVPDGFAPSRVPDEGLTTNRYQVGAAVTGTVSCLWFRQWGAARRSGDAGSEREAERAMATSRRWPILREMAKEGAYPETVWEDAAAMPKGYVTYAGHRRRLLPKAEGLGCARLGLPLLPRKMKIQRERGPPAPPR